MNKQNKLAGIKGLPLIILLIVIFGAGYLLVGTDWIKDIPFFEDKKTLEMQRLEGFPAEVNVMDPELEKQRKVIRSEAELIEFLSYLDKTNSLTVGEKIDFDNQILIGVSSEAFDKDGFEVKVRKIYLNKEKNELLVSTRIMQPGDTCSKITQPAVGVDLVAVDKTDMNVDFETLRETKICKEQ